MKTLKAPTGTRSGTSPSEPFAWTNEEAGESNDIKNAKACYFQPSDEQIDFIEADALVLSAACVVATKQTIPLAAEKLVHDRFHMRQLATKAIDKVRRREH